MWDVEEPDPDPFEATAAPDELSAKLHGQPEPLFNQVLATLRTIPGATGRAQVIRRGERQVLPAELRYAIVQNDHGHGAPSRAIPVLARSHRGYLAVRKALGRESK